MDPLTRIFEIYTQWAAWDVSDTTHVFVMRTMLVFVLPTAACALVRSYGGNNVFTQVITLVFALTLAFLLPVDVDELPELDVLRAFLFTLNVVILIFMPSIMPLVITPIYSQQRKLRIFLYMGLCALFLANAFWRG